MSTALEQRLEAEKCEHQKTHDRLRVAEKERDMLRGLLLDEQNRTRRAVEVLHNVSDMILNHFPKEGL